MPPASVLVFRFGIASVVTLLLALVGGVSLRVRPSLMVWYLGLGVLYFFSAVLLLSGYNYMSTGVATVLHFSYPVFVALIMALGFGERLSMASILAILMALCGVVLLSGITSGVSGVSLVGVGIVLASGLAYALYIVIVNRSSIGREHPLRLSFYILGLAALLCLAYSQTGDGLIFPDGLYGWLNALGLAVIATVVSNVMLIHAISNIGSTPTAVMGALEPMTAVVVGTVAFGEVLSPAGLVGVVLVLSAVVTLVFRKR